MINHCNGKNVIWAYPPLPFLVLYLCVFLVLTMPCKQTESRFYFGWHAWGDFEPSSLIVPWKTKKKFRNKVLKSLKWITLTIVSQSVPYTASSKQDERTDITDSFGVSRPGVFACFVRLRHERLLDCWSAVAINRVLFLGSAGNVFIGFDIFIFEPWDSCKASSGREFTPAMATSNRRRNVSLHTFFFWGGHLAERCSHIYIPALRSMCHHRLFNQFTDANIVGYIYL